MRHFGCPGVQEDVGVRDGEGPPAPVGHRSEAEACSRFEVPCVITSWLAPRVVTREGENCEAYNFRQSPCADTGRGGKGEGLVLGNTVDSPHHSTISFTMSEGGYF